jgi:hypothetical protein
VNVWLLVLVALCGASYWFGKDLVFPGGKGGGVDVPTVPAADRFDMPTGASAIHLKVLNGTEQSGLARDVGLLLGRAGCVAENVGNAPHRGYAESFLVNRRLTDRRAEDLAGLLGGVRVVREMDGRGSEDAVLVLGDDWPRLTSTLEAVGAAGHN